MAKSRHIFDNCVRPLENAAFLDKFRYANFILKVPFCFFAFNQIQKR